MLILSPGERDRARWRCSPVTSKNGADGGQFFLIRPLRPPRYHGWLQRCFQVLAMAARTLARTEARILGAACARSRGFPRFRDPYLWTGCSGTRERWELCMQLLRRVYTTSKCYCIVLRHSRDLFLGTPFPFDIASMGASYPHARFHER